MDHIQYLAIFLGSLMAGETALISGAFMVHRGYLTIAGVMMAAIMAAVMVDWVYFIIGRKHARKFLHNKPRLTTRLHRVTSWIERYPILFMMFYRFMYGIRIPLTISFGLSSYSAFRFGILSFIGTTLWAACYASIGYYCGAFIEANLYSIKKYEFHILGVLIIVSLIVFYWIRKRNLKKLQFVDIAT